MKPAEAGRRGEDAAARYLARRGLRIRDRGFRTRLGEIDLVAEEACGTIVFVEVKTRRRGALDDGRGAVDRPKQRRIAGAAAFYLARHGLGGRPCRFDVILVSPGSRESWRIRHFQGAFSV